MLFNTKMFFSTMKVSIICYFIVILWKVMLGDNTIQTFKDSKNLIFNIKIYDQCILAPYMLIKMPLTV